MRHCSRLERLSAAGPLVPALALVVIAGCGAGTSAQRSQVVARVDGAEITVSQLNEALAAKGAEALAPQAARQTLDGLIDEELLYGQALKSELDRNPAVIQALEHARRGVLARAYAERMVFPADAVSVPEQLEYYNKHPELFAKRRIYQIVAYTLSSASLTDALRRQLDSVHSAEAVRELLSAHRIAFESQALIRAAEQLPLDSLAEFAAASPGDLLITPAAAGRTMMMLVTAAEDSPIDVERAQPIIQQYLLNLRNSSALDDYLRRARTAAKITYYGDMAQTAQVRATPAAIVLDAPAGTARSSSGVSRE